jgi:hypothetical protein
MLTPREFNQAATAIVKAVKFTTTDTDGIYQGMVTADSVLDILRSFTDGFVEVTREGRNGYNIKFGRPRGWEKRVEELNCPVCRGYAWDSTTQPRDDGHHPACSTRPK